MALSEISFNDQKWNNLSEEETTTQKSQSLKNR